MYRGPSSGLWGTDLWVTAAVMPVILAAVCLLLHTAMFLFDILQRSIAVRGGGGRMRGNDQRSRSGPPRYAAAYLTLSLVLLAFFATFFNRFAGLRSGSGEFSGGIALLAGRLPYRDYYTASPPLNALKSALLLKVFGPLVLVSRTAGVLERVLLGALLFRWLRQIAAARYALVAAVVTIVLSAGDSTDPIASYNHDALLWAIVAGLAASFALQREGRGLRFALPAFTAGLAAALSVLTKQTVGLAALACLVVVLPVLLRSLQARLRWLGYLALGCVPPIAGMALVLDYFGVLRAAARMLFVAGPAAKAGHPGDFFLRMGLVAWDNFGWLTLGLFALFLLWQPLRRAASVRFEDSPETPSQTPSWTDCDVAPRFLAVLLGASAVVFCMAEALRSLPALHDFTKASVYCTSFALLLLIVVLLRALAGRTLSAVEAQVALFAAMSLAVSLALALSWPAFEAMLLPGSGLVIALALGSMRASARRWLYLSLAFLALMQLREKLDLPFAFALQGEGPVRLATAVSTEPALRGLRLPPATVHFLDGVTALVRTHAGATDTIFTYPELGLIYSLTGRNPPTFAASHNIDVVNDAMAHEEALRLLASRPAVIITYRLSEEDQRGAERLWRRGRPSGQRELVEAVRKLTSGYHLIDSYRLTPTDPPIEVYLRP